MTVVVPINVTTAQEYQDVFEKAFDLPTNAALTASINAASSAASTADGKAVAAQSTADGAATAASTADGKAVAAQADATNAKTETDRQKSAMPALSNLGATPVTADIAIIVNASLTSHTHLDLTENDFNVQTPITILEHNKIIGQGFMVGSETYESGTLLKNSSGTATILIDGDWATFDSRRFISLKDFAIKSDGGSPITMLIDFLTLSEINNVFVTGDSDYHMRLRNSYNNKISGGRYKGAAVANMLIDTDNNAADSVFSGQALIENVDFWAASNVDNDAAGTIINAASNLIEQLTFLKCHWQDNNIGMWVKKGGDKTLISAHFEANTINDLKVDSIAKNPKILSGNVNNAVTTTTSFLLDGTSGCVNNVDFLNVTNNAACITADTNCKGLSINGGSMSRKSGATMKGVIVKGQDISISNLTGITLGSAGTWPLITLEATARNIYIGNLNYVNFGGTAPVVDNGAENVVYDGAMTIESKEFTLNGGTQEDIHFKGFRGYVNRAWLVYTSAAGAGTTTVNIGRSVSAGASDFPRYTTEVTVSGAAKFTRKQLTISNSFLSVTDAIIFRCVGDSVAGGTVKLIVEVTPFRALT